MRAMSSFGRGRVAPRLASLLLGTTILSAAPAVVFAADAKPATVEEIIVTAQKREENLQRVPLSIQAIGTQKLQELQVTSFDSYAKFLPSVSFQELGPGFSNVYMRGVASGGDGNHSGSLPSVGIYLDEQPITTIGGALDIHVYDIARVESLSGPQGTLYGASSQAGTVRIITNKPEFGVTKGSYDVSINKVDQGGMGHIEEGYINLPVAEKAAIRLVAWNEHDAGYIDNVPGTRHYATANVTINNAAVAKKDYNDVDIHGARAALRVELNENWTLTPTIMGQQTTAHGIFAYDPSVGDLKVKHFYPEGGTDRWYQAAMTVQGKVGSLDLTYAGAYMDRKLHTTSDYTDYSFFYDQIGYVVYDNLGHVVDPSQRIVGDDHFTKQSHEIRLASPQGHRFRYVAGLFYERQTHDILQDYKIDALGTNFSVTGHPHTIWLTDQFREDIDSAVFGEATYDITPKLTISGGMRYFKAENSLKGFFGFASTVSHNTGEFKCFGPAVTAGAPCTNLNKSVSESGHTEKVNLTYKIDDDRMVYATYSTGFRPGGINRRASLPPYKADFLTNYEIGWKTSSPDHTLRFNGAIFLENWKDFQFSVLGQNSFTEIRNAGQAQIKGAEADFIWRPNSGLTFSGAASYTDAHLTKNYCGALDPATQQPITVCPVAAYPYTPQAPSGTELPVTPKLKANLVTRYEWGMGGMNAHVQGAVVYQGSSWADLRVKAPSPVTGVEIPIRSLIGKQEAYTTVDLTAGVEKDNWTFEFSLLNAFDSRGDVYRYAECTTQICGFEPYVVPSKPRTFGVRFGQKF